MARAQASACDDPIKKKQILDTINEIESLLPQEIEAARQLMANPDDPEAQKKLQDIHNRLTEALNQLDPNDISGTARKQQQLLDNLVDAARRGDQKRVDEIAKTLQPTSDQLAQQSRTGAKQFDDPQEKQNVGRFFSLFFLIVC